jgi:hypothetical protein
MVVLRLRLRRQTLSRPLVLRMPGLGALVRGKELMDQRQRLVGGVQPLRLSSSGRDQHQNQPSILPNLVT